MFRRIALVAMVMMLFVGMQAGRANAGLVTNGGFETGDFSAWALTNVTADDLFGVVGPGTGHSGDYEAVLGKSGSLGTISQDITTTAGQSYTVSFWLANDNLGSTNVFQALWNGVVQTVSPVVQTQAFDYTLFQYVATASGSTTAIGFAARNDDAVFHLDDVDAAPVPLPAALLLFGPGLAGLAIVRRRIGL